MKKILIAIIALAPVFCHAQNVKPLTPEQKLEQAQKQLEEAQKAVEAAKANAAKAQKAAAEAKAKADAEAKAKEDSAKQAKAKELAAKQAAIQEQIKKAQAEAARLNAEAEKLNAEAKEAGTTIPATPLVPAEKKAPAEQKAQTGANGEIEYTNTNGWSTVAAPAVSPKTAAKKVTDIEDLTPYLAGAVPMVNGKVVFGLDIDVPGKSAGEIYNKVFGYINSLTVDDNQNTKGEARSKIVIVNKGTHSIAAKMYEWLVFTNNFVMIDQTEFNYTLIATCTEGHLHVSLERISYTYEANRSTGFTLPAQEVITDKASLNKKMTKLVAPYGKFRRKTIDRKNEIFAGITNLFK